jgi:HEAT repeat protein
VALIRRGTELQSGEEPPELPAADLLERQLSDPDPDRRRSAALNLEGVAESVPALLDRLDVETEPAVRHAILTSLVHRDTREVAARLARHLTSDDAGLRTAAAEALAAMPGSVLALMPDLIGNPDHDVRIMTAMILANIRHVEAVSWLAAMIPAESHPNVVAAAISALLPSARAEHESLLRQAMHRFPDDPFLRFVVEMALPRLAGSSE